MKKSHLLSLVYLFAVSNSCFPMEEGEKMETAKRVTEIIESLKAPTKMEKKIEAVTVLIEGHEKEIWNHCWWQLDDTLWAFLKRLESKPLAKRQRDVGIDYSDDHLKIHATQNQDLVFLRKIPEEQEVPLYILTSLLQMGRIQPPKPATLKKKRNFTLKQLIRVSA